MYWFAFLAVVSAGLALGLPPNPDTLHKMHISSLTYRLAITMFLLPYGVIWYMAFYAFAKLSEYSRSIRGSKDGNAFDKIAVGMGVLAFGLVVPSIVSIILQNIAMHHPGFKPAAVIIANYLRMFVLVSFLLIGNGTRMLTDIGKKRPSLSGLRLVTLLITAISVVFTYVVFYYHANHPDVYYLHTPLLIFTLIIPYLFGWFMGLLSAYEFGLYAKYVKGLLYRQALRKLSQGIAVTILSSILIQFVASSIVLKNSRSLEFLLFIGYILLLIEAVGLTLVALGTKKLQKIEEV